MTMIATPTTTPEPLVITEQTFLGQNFIAGEWQVADTTFDNMSPNHTNKLVGRFPNSTAKDVDAAVRAAVDAYPAWKKTPAPERAKVLYRLALILEGMKEDMAREMTLEMGKSLEEARGDIQEAIDMAYYVAAEGRRLFGQTTPSELPNKWAMTLRQPVGVCGLITPWNFPIAVPSWKLLPCILAGNTVVFKPAEDAPLMGQRFVEAFDQAGLPKGVLNLVQGIGNQAGKALVEHKDVRLISFTGSSETGAQVAKTCGEQLKRVALEMGGKNACIVMEDADIALAAKGLAWGAFGTSGQRCTATSRLLVQSSVKDALLDKLLEHTHALDVGDTNEGAAIGPLVNQAQLDKVLRYIEIGKNEGARLRCGGERVNREGFFVSPTIFDNVTPSMRIAQEEIFGPVLSVIEFDTFEEAIEIANGVEYGLSSAIFTNSMSQAFRAINELEAGITYVNAPSIGAEVHLPFGGVKKTGNGHREAAETALDIFTEWKTVYIDYSGELQRAQIDNY